VIDIELAAVPTQSLTVQLDGRVYDITLRDCGACISASIARDGVAIASNLRVTSGTPLLPYRYQEAGNFLLVVENEALPNYLQFGITQFLVYLSAAELEALRG